MKLAIATSVGLLVGLLMLIPFVSQSIGRAYMIVNYPAVFTVFKWGQIGLPHPSGEWGELRFLPYAIVAQWTFVGALGGLIWNIRAKRKHTQQDESTVPSKGAPSASSDVR